MRVMVKFTFPTQESNALVSDGSIGQTMQTIIGNLQPEAAYFCHVEGKRWAISVPIWRKGPS